MITDGEKIDAKFCKLIEKGEIVPKATGWNGRELYANNAPPTKDYYSFRTEALNLLEMVCGKDSAHSKELKRLTKDERAKHSSLYFTSCMGILEAAYIDFTEDFLFDLRDLVRADLIDDILDQAEHLLDSGYHIPAASLTGALLENTLRKMCDKNSIAYSVSTNINVLNTELAKASVYDKLVIKEIIAKADIRNNADHGHFDRVKKEDVKDMVTWVRRFISEHLK